MEGDDSTLIKDATDKLNEVSYEAFGKIYADADAQANAAGAQGADAGAEQTPPEDDVVDADYEVVDEDEGKDKE